MLRRSGSKRPVFRPKHKYADLDLSEASQSENVEESGDETYAESNESEVEDDDMVIPDSQTSKAENFGDKRPTYALKSTKRINLQNKRKASRYLVLKIRLIYFQLYL